MVLHPAELLHNPVPLQGAHLPRTLLEEHAYLHPAAALHPLPSPQYQWCQCQCQQPVLLPSLQREGTERRSWLQPAKSKIWPPLQANCCILTEAGANVVSTYCFCLFLWYLYYANLVSIGFTERGNRREMKTTGLPATKNCLKQFLTNQPLVPTLGISC